MFERMLVDAKLPQNAVIRVEEMKGGIVLSVEMEGQIIFTMAYDEVDESYGILYDRNDKRARQVHDDLMGWKLLH